MLRDAEERDRRQVYEWLAHSDLTPSMMGPPSFPDHPVPSWEEFCEDYRPHYFDGSNPLEGRCFIIAAEDVELGTVCYNSIDSVRSCTSVDIWLRSEKDCGHSYGSDALQTLSDYLHVRFGIVQIVVSPSARNTRAIASYKKAGFRQIPEFSYRMYVRPEEMEYTDTVVLVRKYTDNEHAKTTP